jgi:hypothetical protein
MTKCMESAAPNPELFEQRIELTFPHRVRIPRCAVARCEQQAQTVRLPGSDIAAKVLDQQRRDLTDAIARFDLERQSLAIMDQCRLTIAAQKATVIIERIVFLLFQVS